MENTHINFGGHKVTTNTQGTKHQISCTGNFSQSPKIEYVVNNGICTISGWGLKCSASGGGLIVCSNLPPAKIPVGTYGNSTNCGYFYIDYSAPTVLKMHASIAFDTCYFSMTYPVADDWSE